MHGRRSLNPDLAFDPDPERLYRILRTPRQSIPEIQHMANNMNLGDGTGLNQNPLIPHARTLQDYYRPTAYTSPSCILLPATVANFEIKPNIIQMLPTYHGQLNENPYRHLQNFLEVNTTFKLTLSDDQVRLRLFPFTLKDRAKEWLYSLAHNSISTWEELQAEFLKKYFPVGRTNKIRNEIITFTQQPNEQFHESWERMKSLLRSCPHHDVPKWQLVQRFHEGVCDQHKTLIDASCGGTFMKKTPDDAWDLLEDLSENSLHSATLYRTEGHLPGRSASRGGMYDVKPTNSLEHQVASLTERFDRFFSQLPSHSRETRVDLCGFQSERTLACPRGT